MWLSKFRTRDFIAKLWRQQAEVIIHHENVPNLGQGEQ
jgi:hypothetical protein